MRDWDMQGWGGLQFGWEDVRVLTHYLSALSLPPIYSLRRTLLRHVPAGSLLGPVSGRY